MELQNLEQTLVDTYQDFRLDKDEKHLLQKLLSTFKSEPTKLNFARNKAFSLVAENYRSGDASYLDSLKWLEQVVKAIDSVRTPKTSAVASAYFSPGEHCVKKIISLISRAKKSIDVCVFTISDDRLSEALLKAFQRGIEVKIVTDNDKANDTGSDIYYLADNKVPIRIDQTPNHMHHKFAIFDSEILVNGSFNWTRSASKYNHENIVVEYSSGLINKFSKTFEQLWDESVLIE
ncbi:phospholipase D-like domain-containing protein [Aliikangiella coralliicola]|uniref:phospholipase D n=1 Tax=Aliikangiella coralliicola TaxID=2592383 RepID=A0A545UHW8_9GAMM|nr:phospholipase D-like domain-containing protein [Aliikangiella coralliicola]TQV89066.1 nuclease [Aliikangiella coralliicola]